MTHSNKFKSVAINLYKYLNVTHNYNVIAVASILNISKSTLYNWICLNQKNPDIFIHVDSELSTPKSLKITTNVQTYICNYVLKNIYFNIKLLIRYVKRNFHVSISRSYIYHILKKNNVTHKRLNKKTIPKQYHNLANKLLELSNKISNVDLSTLISVDESSILIGQKPNYGWSPKGTRAHVNLLPNQKKIFAHFSNK
ncbi:MAG: transposase [Harvfovirus sp.]|uniref:Transposase n=1 Tax=Harvfovirus sp. TaxID=2487768 RepID=A0A3G5A035_9VIRU|nr:MAG: transposase [Harvfovirus sp.]